MLSSLAVRALARSPITRRCLSAGAPPPPPAVKTKRHVVLPLLWLSTGGFLYYMYNNNQNDAHAYWKKMERGDIEGPMFDIGMKGVKKTEENEA